MVLPCWVMERGGNLRGETMDETTFDNIFQPYRNRIGQCGGPLFWLVNKVETLDPHVILEIGLGQGGSLRVWEKLLKPDNLLVGVDINPEIKNRIFWDWGNSDRKVKIIVGDSTDLKTVNKVKEALGKKKVDFLYIDGGHTYQTVSSDFYNYSPLVRSGGLVGFHDLEDSKGINRQPDHESDITKLFNELGGKKELSERRMRVDGLICTRVWWKP